MASWPSIWASRADKMLFGLWYGLLFWMAFRVCSGVTLGVLFGLWYGMLHGFLLVASRGVTKAVLFGLADGATYAAVAVTALFYAPRLFAKIRHRYQPSAG